jgi:hypothetical protein
MNLTTTPRLDEIAFDIRMRMKRTVEDIIHIGKGLMEAKDQLGYSDFGKWCDAQFPHMNRETRSKFIQVAERFGNVRLSDNVSPTVYQLLASPSVPDEVVSEVIQRAGTGEKITTGEVRKLLKKEREVVPDASHAEHHKPSPAEEKHPLAQLQDLVKC